jgi:DNA-binding NarL/FixJ family response regulator
MQRTDYDGTPASTTGQASTAESAPGRIAVLVAHGSPLISAGLAAVLKAAPGFDVIGCGEDGWPQRPSLQNVASASVAVADCALGLEMAANTSHACHVVIFTDDESEASIRLAVERGVSGYLLLTSARETLVDAVRSAHQGGTVLDPVVTAKIVASLGAPALSLRETEVLGCLMAGLSDKTIARRLRRSVGTVKSHVKSVLAKLDVESRAEAAAVARRRGLVSPETIPPTLSAFGRPPRMPNIHASPASGRGTLFRP